MLVTRKSGFERSIIMLQYHTNMDRESKKATNKNSSDLCLPTKRATLEFKPKMRSNMSFTYEKDTF